MSYLLVDGQSDRVLLQYELLEEALSMLGRLQEKLPERDLFVARFDDRPGELVGTKSLVTVRVFDR